MYARDVQGRKLHFGVSGMLWEGSLVMVDEETQSLWSHLLGAAMHGPMKGQELEVVPSIMTDWETWKSRYPDSTLMMMERTAGRYRRGMLADEAAFGIGLVIDKQAKLWPLPLGGVDDKRRVAVVNDRLANRELLVFYNSFSETAAIYDRVVDGKTLTFVVEDDEIKDKETQSTWDPILGLATAGPLEGKRLASLPGMISEMAAWSSYHASTEVWSPAQ